MTAIDWEGLLRRALAPQAMGGLGLTPGQFWSLSPVELRLMLGAARGPQALGRAGMRAMMARFPDGAGGKGDGDAGA